MSTPDERFAQCWRDDGPRVLAYARRQVGGHDAHDVVSETFLAAWRRWDEVPDPPIPWLLVTARRVAGNQRRSSRRHVALADRIALLDGVASAAEDTAEAALARGEALEGLAGLTEQHREALLLVSWDDLTTDEAATVLGLRPAAFRRRVSRARAALTHPDDDRPSQPRLRLAPALPVLTTSKDLT